MQTPAWINGELMGACAQLSQFDDELYRWGWVGVRRVGRGGRMHVRL